MLGNRSSPWPDVPEQKFSISHRTPLVCKKYKLCDILEKVRKQRL